MYLSKAIADNIMSSTSTIYNVTSDLSLQGFDLPPEKAIVAFIFAALNYIIILFCNSFLLFTIINNKGLHEPMYILLLNLPINDLIGSTCLFPHIMRELLFDTRTMPFSICITQAFFIHVYALSAVFVLTVMAYDRYVAICQPMRYTTIMSELHLTKIISLVWLTNLTLIAILFILLLRLPRCRSYLTHPYCDNPSLLQLVCADTTINNLYGLLITALCQVLSDNIMSSTSTIYNVTSDLSLQGFDLPPEKAIVAFVFAALNYIIILFCNSFLLFTIINNKGLHEPMTMPFSICITQAFFIHVYAVSVVFILTAMAYDRYVAICQPMRYTTIMSKLHLTKIISLVWLTNLTLMAILFILLLRLPRLVAVTRIASISQRWKAFHTCLTHLLLVLLYYMPVLVAYVLGNLRLVGNVDLFTAILTISVTIPPMVNPIIYSLKTDELRDKIVKLLGKTKVANG
ncbi:odorant receptor [Labeo rohita]|uniref:Odorant receptor n=1 Tax=Labeo rohita TaxID=84645 RepID=A0A498N9Z8_LABRO|nr:odorant receptor [Labeo rohita]RXN25925.1 odorant receptor [Labeo rohita]